MADLDRSSLQAHRTMIRRMVGYVEIMDMESHPVESSAMRGATDD